MLGDLELPTVQLPCMFKIPDPPKVLICSFLDLTINQFYVGIMSKFHQLFDPAKTVIDVATFPVSTTNIIHARQSR